MSGTDHGPSPHGGTHATVGAGTREGFSLRSPEAGGVLVAGVGLALPGYAYAREP